MIKPIRVLFMYKCTEYLFNCAMSTFSFSISEFEDDKQKKCLILFVVEKTKASKRLK